MKKVIRLYKENYHFRYTFIGGIYLIIGFLLLGLSTYFIVFFYFFMLNFMLAYYFVMKPLFKITELKLMFMKQFEIDKLTNEKYKEMYVLEDLKNEKRIY